MEKKRVLSILFGTIVFIVIVGLIDVLLWREPFSTRNLIKYIISGVLFFVFLYVLNARASKRDK